MEKISINREFVNFGKKMHSIYVCFYVFLFLFICESVFYYLWNWFYYNAFTYTSSDDIINRLIVRIGILVVFILMSIFTIQSLKSVNKIGHHLNNKYLINFCPKYITGFCFKTMGFFIFATGLSFLFQFVYFEYNTRYQPNIDVNYFWTMFGIFIIGSILMIIGAFIEMSAWNNVWIFFEQNIKIFPGIYLIDELEGSKNLRFANICYVLGFLVIPYFIGILFSIGGYSKLSRLKRLEDPFLQQAAIQQEAIQQEAIQQQNAMRPQHSVQRQATSHPLDFEAMQPQLNPEEFERLLANNHTFTFKAQFSGWYVFYIFLGLVFGIVALVMLNMANLAILGVILLIMGVTIPSYFAYWKVSFSLLLAPDSITVLKRKRVNFKCSYQEIFDVEFFIRTVVVNNVSSRENMFRIIKKNGGKKVISADYWVTPRPLPSNVFVRKIITYYFNKPKMINQVINQVLSAPSAPSASTAPSAPTTLSSSSALFCHGCGEKLKKPDQQFCHKCGSASIND